MISTELKRNLVLPTALICAVFGFNNMAQAADPHIVGSVFSLKTGDLLYRESYFEIEGTLHKVEYSEPDGSIFGRKTIDLSKSFVTPSFSQLNERNGEAIDVAQEGRKLIVNYKEDASAKQKTKQLELTTGMVVDAGFNGFIQQYWSVLMDGKELDVDFLVPSKQTTFQFRLSRSSCVSSTKEGAVCFSLSPVSWFVKLAVDPIVVAYDATEKTLLRFTGRGNIANSEGKYESVDIQYRYLK
ncbi:MAG: hypothetical protein ABJE79_12400 [Marinomonas sp.]